MSSYMIDNENLSRLAEYVTTILDVQEMSGTCAGAKAICLRGSVTKEFKSIPRLFEPKYGLYNVQEMHRAMFELNRQALVSRYHSSEEEYEPMANARIDTREETRDEWQCRLFYLLQCFLYQCNEGEGRKMPLYRALEGLSSALAEKIAFDTAKRDWGCAWGEWKPRGGERDSKMEN